MDFPLSFRDYKLCNIPAQLVESISRIFRFNSAVAAGPKDRREAQPLNWTAAQGKTVSLHCLSFSLTLVLSSVMQTSFCWNDFFIPGNEYVGLGLWLVSSHTQMGRRPNQELFVFRQWVSSGSINVSERKYFSQITENFYENVFLYYRSFGCSRNW